MSEKHPEQFTPPAEKSIERIEGIECPEDKENFEGQKVLVIGGPDAHGVSMAVSSAQYLEKGGAEAVIYVGSPVIREGRGATHPGAFYTKTIPELNVGGYDRVVISDIPLDFRNLENSEKAIAGKVSHAAHGLIEELRYQSEEGVKIVKSWKPEQEKK